MNDMEHLDFNNPNTFDSKAHSAKNKESGPFANVANVDKLTMQEKVYRHIRYNIMIGRLKPGEPLTIRGLAEKLKVSPTPIREALRRLSSEGALDILDNRRVITPTMALDKFDELIELRILLESYAAKSALPYVNKILIDKAADIDLAIDKSIAKNDFEQTVILNHQFHATIYQANIHQVCMPSIESIWLQLGPYSRITLENLDEVTSPVDHHKKMIDCLRSLDAKGLVNAVADDIHDGIGKYGRKAFL